MLELLCPGRVGFFTPGILYYKEGYTSGVTIPTPVLIPPNPWWHRRASLDITLCRTVQHGPRAGFHTNNRHNCAPFKANKTWKIEKQLQFQQIGRTVSDSESFFLRLIWTLVPWSWKCELCIAKPGLNNFCFAGVMMHFYSYYQQLWQVHIDTIISLLECMPRVHITLAIKT